MCDTNNAATVNDSSIFVCKCYFFVVGGGGGDSIILMHSSKRFGFSSLIHILWTVVVTRFSHEHAFQAPIKGRNMKHRIIFFFQLYFYSSMPLVSYLPAQWYWRPSAACVVPGSNLGIE